MKEEEIYTKLFNFSRPTFFKWKREKRLAIILISKYFSKEDLVEFLEKGYVSKYENFSDYALDPVFEDYVIINMKRLHRLNHSFLLFQTAEFITKMDSKFIEDLTITNAKDKMIDFLKRVKLNKFLNTETKRFKIMEEIKTDFSDLEIYVLLKHYDKF